MALLVGLIIGAQNAPQDHKLLFEKAKFAMETKGDLQGAIKLFQEIVTKYPKEKEYASKAQLYIGLCYEKLGNSEAIKAYELVLKNFADRPEEVAVARECLASLKQRLPAGGSVVNLPKGAVKMSVDAVSPDGTKLLGTDENGENIAVHDTVANRTHFLTNFDSSIKSPMASSPIWSPDGTQIAYLQSPDKKGDRSEVRISDLSGNSRTLISLDDSFLWPADWLHDGSAVLVFRTLADASVTLCSVPVRGGAFKTICPLRKGSTHLSAQASPDGRFIVICEGPVDSHDLRIVGIDGRTSRNLTEHPADDRHPLWSPDGKYVVFMSTRQGGNALWGQRVKEGQADGQPFLIEEMLPKSYTLNWTNRGLAYYRWTEISDIYFQSVESGSNAPVGKPRILPSATSGKNSSLRWSDGGEKFAYMTGSPGSSWRLVVKPADMEPGREYPAPNHYWISETIAWLPDGTSLGFGTWPRNSADGKTNIFQLNLAAGDWKPVALPKIHSYYIYMEWGREPGSIYYTNNDSPADTGIVERNLMTGVEKYIYRPEAGKNHYYNGLRLSRDRKSLAIRIDEETKPGSGTSSQLIVLDLDTGRARTVYSGKGWIGDVGWSPDGKFVLATLPKETGEAASELDSDLTIISVTQGSPKKLKIEMDWPAKSGLKHHYAKPDWSPVGKQIAFTAVSSKEEIFLMKNVIPEDKLKEPRVP